MYAFSRGSRRQGHKLNSFLPGSAISGLWAVFVLFGASLIVNCGGGVAPQRPRVSVAIFPLSTQAFTGSSIQFGASVVNASNTSVTWSVNGTAGGNAALGTIDASGLYKAPPIPPSPNNLTVKATSVADNTSSASATVTVINPAPTVNSIAPTTIYAGSGDTPLTVSGSNFGMQSQVMLAGAPLATSFGSATRLTAVVPAAQLAEVANFPVTVFTPSPGGGISNAVTFAVMSKVTVSLPAQAVLTTQVQQFTATVTGTSNQAVTWSVNGVIGGGLTVGTITTSGLYTAPAVPPSPNVVTVTATSVVNPEWSGSVSVTIINPTPAISSVTPATINAGSESTTLTVTGTNFARQSAVVLGGTTLATSFVSATQVTATALAGQLANAGSFPVTVVTPSPGGGTSNALTLTVPAVVAVSPAAQVVMTGQGQQFTATVTGISNQTVTWSVNGVSGGNATVGTINAAGLYAAPAIPPSPNVVTVTATSAANSAWSSSVTATIVNPAPAVTAVAPTTINAGSGNTMLTVTGSNFAKQSAVALGGTTLATSFVSATQVTATALAGQLANAGSLQVTVVTPSPGGGISNAATLTVLIVIGVNPTSPLVTTSQAQQFTATVTGSSTASIQWSVNGIAGGDSTLGVIDSTGLYTAPIVPPSPNSVTVTASAGGQSASATVQIVSPQPVMTSITPTAGTAGSGDSTITVTGSGFNPLTVVSADGAALSTSFQSASQITAVIPAAQLSSPGIMQIGVSTPVPGGGSSGPVQFTVVNLGQVSATGNLLVASYTLNVPRDANVRVDFGPDTTYAQRTWSRPTPTGGGPVTILVAGMRGSTTYHLRAVAGFQDGTEYVGPDQTFTTGDISGMRFPRATVTLSGVGQPQPGVESLEVMPIGYNDPTIVVVITNLQGNIIWYYPLPVSSWGFPIKLLPNGHFLLSLSSNLPGATLGLREIDLAGNTIREMDIPALNQALADAGFGLSVISTHHDFALLPNGHTVILTDLGKTVTTSTGDVSLMGDALIDLDENWKPVWVWNTFDHLDVNRNLLGPTGDWTHGNTVVYTPDDGNLIFSMRNQCWVIKIDYQDGKGTGGILWTSGYQGDLALTGNNLAQWHYGQHYPIVISPESAGVFQMAVYDNGNDRITDSAGTICGQSGTPPCYSRAVIYSVDEVNKTSTKLWEYNASPVFTPYIGSVQTLPNGNVEVDLGMVSMSPSNARVVEVTHTASPQIVWQMDVDHWAYRALRMPSLYPGVQW